MFKTNTPIIRRKKVKVKPLNTKNGFNKSLLNSLLSMSKYVNPKINIENIAIELSGRIDALQYCRAHKSAAF